MLVLAILAVIVFLGTVFLVYVFVNLQASWPLAHFPPERGSIRSGRVRIRFIQVISDASKSTVDGIRRICRGDVKPPGRLRGSLTKFVFISNGFFGTKDQF
jgi:hypothetical protein